MTANSCSRDVWCLCSRSVTQTTDTVFGTSVNGRRVLVYLALHKEPTAITSYRESPVTPHPLPKAVESAGRRQQGAQAGGGERGLSHSPAGEGREPGDSPREDADGCRGDRPSSPALQNVGTVSRKKGVWGWRTTRVRPCFPPAVPGATL